MSKNLSIKEIKTAIAQLPASELPELMAWFISYQQQIWDSQIEADLETGHLDALLAAFDEEYEAGLA